MSYRMEQNYENINLKNIIDKLENDNKNKLTEISYLYNKCKKLEKANNIYKSIFGDEMPIEVTTLRNKNKILESNLRKFDQTFKSEMEKRDDEISFLEIKNFNLENENSKLNEKLQDVETLINNLKSEKESLLEAIESLKNTNESISKTLEEQSNSWLPKFF